MAIKDYLNWLSRPEISFSLIAIVLFLLVRGHRLGARGTKGVVVSSVLTLLAVLSVVNLQSPFLAICMLTVIPFFGGERFLLGAMGVVAVASVFAHEYYFVVTLLGVAGVILLPLQIAWTMRGLFVMGVGVTAALVFLAQDPHFGGPEMLGKADNVPILAMIYVFGFFLWASMAQAVTNDRRVQENLPPVEKDTSDQRTWVWPDLLYIEFIALIIFSILLIVWSLFIPAPLEEPANPAKTPNPSKAPWYFLGLQEMLVYYDPWYAGVVLPTLIILGLCAIPYIDRNPKGAGYFTLRDRALSISTFFFGFFALWVFMILTGTFLRGPGWNPFGVTEEWNPHKVLAQNNVNLSEIVWVKIPTAIYAFTHDRFGWDLQWLLVGMPEVKSVTPHLFPPDLDPRSSTSIQAFLVEMVNTIKREWAGLALMGFYFLALPAIFARKWLNKMYRELGFARFSIFILLFLTMGTLPLKMVLRWTVNLKYFIDTPWIKF
jgi:hypothetical protein